MFFLNVTFDFETPSRASCGDAQRGLIISGCGHFVRGWSASYSLYKQIRTMEYESVHSENQTLESKYTKSQWKERYFSKLGMRMELGYFYGLHRIKNFVRS